jgi:hypothetical protein
MASDQTIIDRAEQGPVRRSARDHLSADCGGAASQQDRVPGRGVGRLKDRPDLALAAAQLE